MPVNCLISVHDMTVVVDKICSKPTSELKNVSCYLFRPSDWYDKQEASVVVVSDLHNFYRCIAVHCNTDVQLAKRNESGSPRDPGLWKSEDGLTERIRGEVTSFLQGVHGNGNLLGTEELLDDRLGDQNHARRTLSDRLRGIYMGSLVATDPMELLAVAFLTKTQVHIFEETGNGYELRAKHPFHVYSSQQPITLLRKSSTRGREHFDALIVNGSCKGFSTSAGGTSPLNVYACSANDEDRRITFQQLLNPSRLPLQDSLG
jgi:hypothetical protein